MLESMAPVLGLTVTQKEELGLVSSPEKELKESEEPGSIGDRFLNFLMGEEEED